MALTSRHVANGPEAEITQCSNFQLLRLLDDLVGMADQRKREG
jgi:hypothetical protein